MKRKLKKHLKKKASQFKALWTNSATPNGVHGFMTGAGARSQLINHDITPFDHFIAMVYRFNVITRRHACFPVWWSSLVLSRKQDQCTQYVKYTCSCSQYSKDLYCAHVLVVAIHRGEIEAPTRTDGASLLQKQGVHVVKTNVHHFAIVCRAWSPFTLQPKLHGNGLVI